MHKEYVTQELAPDFCGWDGNAAHSGKAEARWDMNTPKAGA